MEHVLLFRRSLISSAGIEPHGRRSSASQTAIAFLPRPRRPLLAVPRRSHAIISGPAALQNACVRDDARRSAVAQDEAALLVERRVWPAPAARHASTSWRWRTFHNDTASTGVSDSRGFCRRPVRRACCSSATPAPPPARLQPAPPAMEPADDASMPPPPADEADAAAGATASAPQSLSRRAPADAAPAVLPQDRLRPGLPRCVAY